MISKEELEQMYWGEGMTQQEIADEIGVHLNTVNNWMKEHEVESRAKSEVMLKGVQRPFREELQQMYWGQGMSQPEIAKKIGATAVTIGNWMKGYKIEARTLSEAQLNGDFTGERSGAWKGGISFEPYCDKFNNTFKEAVRERDGYTCQLCGYEQLLGGTKLAIHHIHYDKENCCPDVVVLCCSCHAKVNGNRDYWEKYFEEQLIIRGLLNWSTNQILS